MLQTWIEHIQSEWVEHWWAWAVFLLYLVVSWFLAILAKSVTRWLVSKLTARTSRSLDDRLMRAAVGPVRFMVLAAGFRLSLLSLGNRIPSLSASAEFGWMEKGAGALIILAVAAMVNALLKAGLDWYIHELSAGNRSGWDEELLPVVRRVMSFLVYFIAISIVLKNFNQDITALVTTAGVASLAVALAAQETLSNMLGGFVILVDRPFKIGDVIELADGKSGEVFEIGLRSTRIRQFDGNALVVPNKDMANSRIVNMAQPNQRATIHQTISLDYRADIPKAKQLLLGVMHQHPEVLKDPAPSAAFTKFGSNSLELFMSCWVESYRDRFRITDELNVKILNAFRNAGIEIPPAQTSVGQPKH